MGPGLLCPAMGPLSSLPGTARVQSRRRAVVKTLGYRVLMVVVTTVVALAVTNDPVAALNIGVVTNVVKTVIYYAYERAWDRTTWGLSGDG